MHTRTGSILLFSPLISQTIALSPGRVAGDTQSSPVGGHPQILVKSVRCMLIPIPKRHLNQEPPLTYDAGTLIKEHQSSPITAGSIPGHLRFLHGVCGGFSQVVSCSSFTQLSSLTYIIARVL